LTHRARVVAAVEKHLARQAPAGHWPLNQLYTWVVVAGSSLACTHCGVTGKAPLPSSGGYNAACELFLEQHRNCEAQP